MLHSRVPGTQLPTHAPLTQALFWQVFAVVIHCPSVPHVWIPFPGLSQRVVPGVQTPVQLPLVQR